MKLTIEEVEQIAALARLALTDAEKRRYAEQLSDILEYAAKLDELTTEDITPTASVLTTKLRLRKDEVRAGLAQEDALRNAPETMDGHFKVPPVLGN